MITSLQNQRIKDAITLHNKSRERRIQNKFTIEGLREINLAAANGYDIETLFVCADLAIADFHEAKQRIEVSKEVFAKLALRENSDGFFAIANTKFLSFNEIRLSENPFIIVAESIEKPGNLGAILRTADAANVDAVIVCDSLCDIYNPNVIRSSLGCLFTRQILTCTSQQCFEFLKSKKITICAAELKASQFYHQTDMSQACAVIVGTEAAGLSDFWINNADVQIKIPMRGVIDSLNVSVSAAIITFEAMRQRNFKQFAGINILK
ncbi:MAG: RNA methyltransferase [Prevotellaceae bacterium]|jgi:TrmH family RNA methyltransferase|nr:RNA methyltransferase [Prevotellaceae bacterium]